ncbi:MAG: methyltransferase domain-containing protein [Alphaproteobacteria bacterium]|nr:methyltransferase domain-containing protein [Alphaproteobacteria bacterium]
MSDALFTSDQLPAHYSDSILGPEARAFDQRITERIAAGFVPDLQNAVRCEYFYKSFWRDPLFIDLYEGEVVRRYLDLIHTHTGGGSKSILDVGCGAGYVSLELARAGHHVTGIDISAACIAAAERQRDAVRQPEGFGSLDYHACPLEEIRDQYDILLFSVSLHHFPDPTATLKLSRTLLSDDGFLLCCEPCHELFQDNDASQVALIRSLLAAAGLWHEEPATAPTTPAGFAALARGIGIEYREERDPHEVAGQSPNDLQSDGATLLEALDAAFERVAYLPGASFIYRVLGGIRGNAETTKAIARLLAAYDRHAVDSGLINPNFFYFLGRKI